MGAGNVKAAFALWRSRVADKPMTVLLYMALRSLDSDSPPVYFGGHEELASAALGRADDASSPAALQAVKRCVRDLRRAGALETLNEPRTGERAVYALHLRVTAGGQEVTPTQERQGVMDRPPQGVTDQPPAGGHSVIWEGVTNRPPKEEVLQEEQQDLLLGPISTSSSTVTHARATELEATREGKGASDDQTRAAVHALLTRLPGIEHAAAAAAVAAVVARKSPDDPSRYMATFTTEDVHRWANGPAASQPRSRHAPTPGRRTCPSGAIVVREPDGTTSCCEHCSHAERDAS